MNGMKWGKWTVLRETSKDKYGNRRWICRCECGTEKPVFQNSLRSGRSKQCGKCSSRLFAGPAAAKVLTTHGRSRDPIYKAWVELIQRCTNPNDQSFDRYGGRGITVCSEWVGVGGFERFILHLGERPSLQHSVERIDNNGGYEPGNVRWATYREQARNTRSNHIIQFSGERLTLAEWSEKTGIKRETIAQRLRNVWSTKEALTVPTGTSGRRRRDRDGNINC